MSIWKAGLTWLLAAMLFAGCSVLERPNASGVVTQADEAEILVEFDAEHPDLGDNARVLLPPDAPEVQVGDQVSLWLPLDYINESDPPQVSASRIAVDG